MRELTVRIRFSTPSLGNVKDRTSNSNGRYLMPRAESNQLIFLPSWHATNLRLAAKTLGRHQDEVDKIRWDLLVDTASRQDGWYQRYYKSKAGRERYTLHEALMPGQHVGINCVVPSAISDEDMSRLMGFAGRYCGLSPFLPGKFGFFEVVSVRQRWLPDGNDKA